MNTNETINAAHTAAIQMLESNSFVSPDDTVCAVRGRSGRIYTGYSQLNRNAPNMSVHAEADAVRNLLNAGEYIVDELVLISTQSRLQLLPCNNCTAYIISLNPENANCMVLMPDRAIRLSDVGMFAQRGVPDPQVFPGGNPFPPPTGGFNPIGNTMTMNTRAINAFQSPPVYQDDAAASASTEHATNDLLKNKVNNLLNLDAGEDEEESKPEKKKGLFGLFKK
jgi:cytidine deaminase